jgi:putative membrane protein
MRGDYGWGTPGWQVWGFGALAVVGVVILVVVAVRLATSSPEAPRHPVGTPADRPASPKQILDARFARGELTLDEYRERRGALGVDP